MTHVSHLGQGLEHTGVERVREQAGVPMEVIYSEAQSQREEGPPTSKEPLLQVWL